MSEEDTEAGSQRRFFDIAETGSERHHTIGGSRNGITRDEYDRLKELRDEILTALEEADRLIRRADSHEHERWSAGGKSVAEGYMSMYPTLSEVVDRIEGTIEPEETEEEDEPFEVSDDRETPA